MADNDVAGSLDDIEAALRQLGRTTLLRSLLPGLTPEAIRAALSNAGLTTSRTVELVYAWHNGTSTDGVVALDDIHMFPGFYLLSLEDAIANYGAFSTESRWSQGWLPFFANGGGDFYVVDVSSPSATAVRHFRIDESEHPVEYHSLDAMLRTLAQAFERGVFFVDGNGCLEMDDGVYAELATEMNTDVEWWRT